MTALALIKGEDEMKKTMAWWPKMEEFETMNMDFAERMLRLSQDLQRAYLNSARAVLVGHEDLHASWSRESAWPQAMLSAVDAAERTQMEGRKLAINVGQLLIDGMVDSFRHTQKSGRLAQEQAGEVSERIRSAAPETPQMLAQAMCSWLDLFNRKGRESADMSRQIVELAQSIIGNAARREARA